MFWQAWLLVKGEDKSSLVNITLSGKSYDVPEIEALLYWYLFDESSKVSICVYDNEIAGFVIYNRVIEGILAIRWAFIKPKFHGTKMGHRLIDSVATGKTIIFQTQKNLPPEILLNRIKEKATKFAETDLLETWFMKWENKYGT